MLTVVGACPACNSPYYGEESRETAPGAFANGAAFSVARTCQCYAVILQKATAEAASAVAQADAEQRKAAPQADMGFRQE